MFELGRELKRLFGAEPAYGSGEGLTGGDGSLLELLDLNLLLQEGRAAETAAGRIQAKDRPQRRLEATIVWREAARRTGDVAYLRKAAATAEAALGLIDRPRRPDAWARARTEQALCALAGAELFGDLGLNAAAEIAFTEARASARGGLTAALADVGLATIAGREGLTRATAAEAVVLAERFDAPIAGLDVLSRRVSAARAQAAEARLVRADLLCGLGARLKDDTLLKRAVDDAAAAAARLNPDYEPLTWARAEIMRGQALTLWGTLTADVDAVTKAASVLAEALEHLTRAHSPLDWARAQLALAETLQVLGETCGDARAFEQAVTCYDRANLVLKNIPAMPLRGVAASARATCLARSAELTGDLAVLDVAEAAMKMELTSLQGRRDPVGWAVAQLHLARLYEARIDLTGQDRGCRAAAIVSLEAALDGFADEGIRSLSVMASDALRRLRIEARAPLGRTDPFIR
jgi:tetratricopeptide (TPR) repeat protein